MQRKDFIRFDMDWFRLKKNRCPQCFAPLVQKNPWIGCTARCGFGITPVRMLEIVANMNAREIGTLGGVGEDSRNDDLF